MTTLTVFLDMLVGESFTPTQKTNAITSALVALGTADGDNDKSDRDTALYAELLLNKQRIEFKARTEPGLLLQIPALREEMLQLQDKWDVRDDASSNHVLIRYKKPSTGLNPYNSS